MFSKLKISKRITMVFMLFPLFAVAAAFILSAFNIKSVLTDTAEMTRRFGTRASEDVGSLITRNIQRELVALSRMQALTTSIQFESIEKELDAACYMLKLTADNELVVPDTLKVDYDAFFSHFNFAEGVLPSENLKRIRQLESLRGVFMALYAQNDYIRMSGFIAADGVSYRYPWNYVNAKFKPERLDWYKRAVKAGGRMVWSGPYHTDNASLEVLNCARAVYTDKGKLLGVAFVFLDSEKIAVDALNTHGIIGFSLLVGKDGRVIASRETGVRHSLFNEKRKNHAPEEEILAAIRKGESRVFEHNVRGIELLTVTAPLKSTDWSIVISIPKSDILKQVKASEQKVVSDADLMENSIHDKIKAQALIILSAGAVSLVVVLLIALWISSCITNPIEVLNEGASRLGSGDLDTHIDVRTGDELEDLAGTFNQMTIDLRNNIADLEANLAAEERMKQELKIASEIQHSLLPERFPAFPERREFDLYAIMEPAYEVGGDFYDFFFVDSDRLYLCVADVSGKGIPAAMFMARTRMLLRFEAANGSSPDEILLNVNNELEKSNAACMFATVFCAIMDMKTGYLHYASAGHNPPLLCTKDKGFEYLELHKALAIGPMPQKAGVYVTQHLEMSGGDILFIYTDGIVEAENPERKQFGEPRLKEMLNSDRDAWPREMIDDVVGKVHIFAGDARQSDDITALVVKYIGDENND